MLQADSVKTMTDKDTPIGSLKTEVEKFLRERDWERFHNVKDLSMSISIEASELMELCQWKTSGEIEGLTSDPKYLQEMKDELADIIIYSLSLANTLHVDVSEIVIDKLKKNRAKYPAKKAKGSNKKYTEL